MENQNLCDWVKANQSTDILILKTWVLYFIVRIFFPNEEI